MNRTFQGMSRRGFLITGAVAGGGLLVGCSRPSAQSRLGDTTIFAPMGDQVALNGWVKITPDNRVIVAVPRSEMGQGVHTALAMLVADELDAAWSQVQVEQAPLDKIYANTALMLNMLPLQPDDDGVLSQLARSSAQALGYALSLQVTGGSSSVRDAWEPMRLAGATARQLLLAAAAKQWNVPVSDLTIQSGDVLHGTTGRKLHFGELAAQAAQLKPATEVAMKPAAQRRLIGKPMSRPDIPPKTNGQAVFGIDVHLPDLLYAAIQHCPVFGGSVKSIDAQAAKAASGVRDVFVLNNNAVVVIATNTWLASQALAQVKVTWDEGPNAELSSASIATQLRRDLDEKDGSGFRSVGDASKTLASAKQRIEAEYEAPFLAHAAMEPINCTAQVKDGQVTVWCGTQAPSFARMKAAKVAGVDSDRVTLHIPYLGGGFGRRLEFDMVEEAVGIALHTGGRPVKMTWSREEDTQHDLYRPTAIARFQATLDDQGHPLAWHNKVAAPSIGLATMERIAALMAMDTPDKNQIEGAFDLPYAIPNLEVRQVRSKTPVPVGSWRSVGHSYNAFFTESFIDELAHAARQDPLAYRLALLKQHPRHQAVLKLAAQQAAWGQALPAGRARGLALHESFGSICAQVAEVSVQQGSVRVHKVVCALDCGTVINPDTVQAQLQSAVVYGLSAALFGEITLNKGRVEQGNFPSYDAIKLASMPVIETHLIISDAEPGGVGEPGTPPIAPAVANALFALTGQRLRKLPLRPGASPT
jgi:isoquinoline 1-oxidoreductase beta subunit